MYFFISFYKMYWKGADFYLTRLIRLNQTNDSFLCGIFVLPHISYKANFSWAEIVHRHFEHLAAQLLEVLSVVAKSNDLCRTYEREVLQVEKEDHVLPSLDWKIDFLEDAIDHHSDYEVKVQLSDMCFGRPWLHGQELYLRTTRHDWTQRTEISDDNSYKIKHLVWTCLSFRDSVHCHYGREHGSTQADMVPCPGLRDTNGGPS